MTTAQAMTTDDRTWFYSRVFATTGGCWFGPAAAFVTTPSGRVSVVSAHRAMYELERGPIPAGVCVIRTCTTSDCLFPEHLRLATRCEIAQGRRVTARKV